MFEGGGAGRCMLTIACYVKRSSLQLADISDNDHYYAYIKYHVNFFICFGCIFFWILENRNRILK